MFCIYFAFVSSSCFRIIFSFAVELYFSPPGVSFHAWPSLRFSHLSDLPILRPPWQDALRWDTSSNRLTQAQVEKTLAGARFPGRERDTTEVRHYYRDVEDVERLVQRTGPIAETDIHHLHGLVIDGRPSPTPCWDGQNVIQDSLSRGIVYMSPETKDVWALRADLVDWSTRERGCDELLASSNAALARYQYASVCPYSDGNKRTAHFWTHLILHWARCSFESIYRLVEYYAQNLMKYYEASAAVPSHNYYFGRAEADVTCFAAFSATATLPTRRALAVSFAL